MLVLAAGSFLVLNRKGSNSGGTAFALSLVQGQTYRYQMGLAFNGNVSAGGQQIPFNMKAAETISWKIDSLDQDGVANVTMSIELDTGRSPTRSIAHTVAKIELLSTSARVIAITRAPASPRTSSPPPRAS